MSRAALLMAAALAVEEAKMSVCRAVITAAKASKSPLLNDEDALAAIVVKAWRLSDRRARKNRT